jgi:hypothetical protein
MGVPTILAIVSILMCAPTGWPAILFVAQANRWIAKGNLLAARKCARRAVWWSLTNWVLVGVAVVYAVTHPST